MSHVLKYATQGRRVSKIKQKATSFMYNILMHFLKMFRPPYPKIDYDWNLKKNTGLIIEIELDWLPLDAIPVAADQHTHTWN